jgi:hypothetical protein
LDNEYFRFSDNGAVFIGGILMMSTIRILHRLPIFS